MKDILKAILFFVGIYIAFILCIVVFAYLCPYILEIIGIIVIIKIIKKLING